MTEFFSSLDTYDVRFPTSLELDGSDAMNPFPDYSAAYVVLRTERRPGGVRARVHRRSGQRRPGSRRCGHWHHSWSGGRSMRPWPTWRPSPASLTGDSQLRWLGPDKGVIHMAAGAVINALWDLAARSAGKPLWKLLADLSPEQLVAQVDFRYLRDALTEDRRRWRCSPPRARVARNGRSTLLDRGYPAYTTTPGWLGYDDDKLARLSIEADRGRVQPDQTQGRGEPDRRPPAAVRRTGSARTRRPDGGGRQPGLGCPTRRSSGWGICVPYQPYWIEEPTSPDDVLGHAAIRRAVAPIRVATGEHVHNAVMFKQLLQAEARRRGADRRLPGRRSQRERRDPAARGEVRRPGVPARGRCRACARWSSTWRCSTTWRSAASNDGRMIEYVDHLHEHFVEPVRIERGRYRAPRAPGAGARMHPESVDAFRYPDGPQWRDRQVSTTPPYPVEARNQ